MIKYLISCNMTTIVIESNFKDYEMNELKNLCLQLNYDVLSLVFDADDEILHKRFDIYDSESFMQYLFYIISYVL